MKKALDIYTHSLGPFVLLPFWGAWGWGKILNMRSTLSDSEMHNTIMSTAGLRSVVF